MRKLLLAIVAVAAVMLFSIGTAAALVTFDSSTGTGFVGKGDVQLVYGWNNQALQANAGSVQFRASSTTVTEVSWECTNSNNDHVQERARTTTTETQGVVSSIARERNQITGFNLTGYSSTPTTSTATDGPALNSCPAMPSTFYLSTPAGDPVTVSSSNVFQVSINGTTWFTIG